MPDIIHSLYTSARKARSHDLGRIYIRIRARTRGPRDPVDGLRHGGLAGRTPTIRSALGDGEEAVAGDLLEERRVGGADVAAGAVAPDEDGELGGVGGFGGVVDCVVGETVIGFVGAGGVGTCAAALLLKWLEDRVYETGLWIGAYLSDLEGRGSGGCV
jgi:hypothetical protein